MRNTVIKKHMPVLLLLFLGLVVLWSFPVEADKSQVEFETSLSIPAGTYEYRTVSVYVPPSPETVEHMASFEVPSGASVKFCLLISEANWQLWQDGQYSPSWIEGSHGDFGVGGSSQVGEYMDYYLIVQNDGSSSQEVKIWLSKTWHESSKLGLIAGSVLVSLGVGVLPLLMFGKSKLNFGCSAIIFTMTFILVFFLTWAQFWITPREPALVLWALTEAVPGIFFFETFPLIILIYMLHRNNSFAYFKTWNPGRKLQISGSLVFMGFVLPVVFMLFRILSLSLSWPVNPDMLTTFSVGAGGLLMAAGTTIFIGIWATHSRKHLTAVPAQAAIKH